MRDFEQHRLEFIEHARYTLFARMFRSLPVQPVGAEQCLRALLLPLDIRVFRLGHRHCTPDDNKIVQLPGSKWDDLGRPIRDSKDGKEEDTPPAGSAPPVPTLPPLPKEPPAPRRPVVKTPEKPPEKEPEPVQTHTLTIISGEYVQKAVFIVDPIEKTYTGGGLGRNADDAPPRRTASPRPAAKPN